MKLTNLSASRIGTFKQCALKYWAKYEGGYKDRPHPLTLMGSAVHRALEVMANKLLSDVVDIDPIGEIKAACEKYHVRREHWDTAQRCVGNAIRWGYFAKLENSVGREFSFKESLGEVDVTGLMDRLDKFDDWVDVLDLKTQKRQYTLEQLNDHWQVRCYALAALRKYPDITRVRVSFWVLRHLVQRVVAEPQQIAQFEQDLVRVAEEIIGCDDPQPNPSRLCEWCPYYDDCDAGQKFLKG